MNEPLQVLHELHADSFQRAHEICMARSTEGLGIPALVLAAFSAELSLKAILTRRGIEYAKTHGLSNLLKLLPEPDRDEVEKDLRTVFQDFDLQLEAANNAFVEWRYFFESKKPLNVNVLFVGALASALRDRMLEIRA